MLDINIYQDKAISTAIYPGQHTSRPSAGFPDYRVGLGLMYCCLKLSGEAGEFNEKIGKCIRDNTGIITKEKREELIKELGDVLWYISALATELDISMEAVAVANLAKLASRKASGTIGGSGDNR